MPTLLASASARPRLATPLPSPAWLRLTAWLLQRRLSATPPKLASALPWLAPPSSVLRPNPSLEVTTVPAAKTPTPTTIPSRMLSSSTRPQP